MKKTFIVIGLGRFGANVAKTLARMNLDILAIDKDEDVVAAVAKDVSHSFIADSTKMNVLRDLGVAEIDHAVVAIGNNLQASILTVINLKNLGVKMISVRADSEEHKELYRLIGATEVIVPEESSAVMFANQISSDSILDYYQIASDYAMVQITVQKDFGEQTLLDLDLRNNFDVNIVGILRNKEFFVPFAKDQLKVGDIVAVVGARNKLKKFDAYLND